ncbi:hypothetical protein SLE2022_029520 [Rubroshorea leprosula]
MEKGMDWEQRCLLNVLTHGKDLAKQLQKHLNPSLSTQMGFVLVDDILGCYEKALSVLNSGALSESKSAVTMLESPPSVANSTDAASDQKEVSKKRKTMSTTTEYVKASTGTPQEVPLDDGYCWRKYGQKDILGSKHPRGYYRCTHRHSQGCLATKQVQKSDDDPTIFEVTYRGRHTCKQSSHLAAAVAAAPPMEAESMEKPEQPEEAVLNFGTGLRVKTEELETKEEIFPSFPFPYSSNELEEGGSNIFPESMLENEIMASFPSAFVSPVSSESNYFSMSSCHIGSFGLGQTSESDLTEIISAPASVTNSPDLDFSVELDPNFSFDNLECFS